MSVLLAAIALGGQQFPHLVRQENSEGTRKQRVLATVLHVRASHTMIRQARQLASCAAEAPPETYSRTSKTAFAQADSDNGVARITNASASPVTQNRPPPPSKEPPRRTTKTASRQWRPNASLASTTTQCRPNAYPTLSAVQRPSALDRVPPRGTIAAAPKSACAKLTALLTHTVMLLARAMLCEHTLRLTGQYA
jgi:hypothetical protein